jgi:4-amino-4-deoxy-L-arabinose transferase-like glycosyltransferase
MLSGFYRLGLPPQAMLFFNAVLATLTGWVLWRLALAVGLGARGALITAALYLVYPPFISHGVRLLTETPTILLLTAAMLALVEGMRHRSPGRFALAGLLLGLATLARPTTLFLPLALLPLVVWPRGRMARGWLILAAVFALTQAPWVIRNAVTFGKFEPTFTSRGYNLFMGTYPPTRGLSNLPPERQPPELIASLQGKNEFEVNRIYQRAALHNVREEPGEMVKLVLAKAVLCWFNTRPDQNMFLPTPRSFAVNGPLLLLGIVGFVMLLREGRHGAWIPILVIAYFVAMHLASVATIRYNLPSIPFLLLGVAAALDRILARPGADGTSAAPPPTRDTP